MIYYLSREKQMFKMLIAYITFIFTILPLSNAQDEVVPFSEVKEAETGWLICVPEHSRYELANYFPSNAIFLWTDTKGTGKSNWCVVWKDNTLEVITSGINMLFKSLADAFRLPLLFDGNKAAVVRDTPIHNGFGISGKRTFSRKPNVATHKSCKSIEHRVNNDVLGNFIDDMLNFWCVDD